jgi:heme-degrading monooxygenase HmoA
MMQFRDLDPRGGVVAQLDTDAEGPVVLVNVFTVAPDDADVLAAAWADDAAWFKAQPGFISAQLHKAVGPPSAFFNYAVWESLAAFRAAFGHPEFRRRLAAYPDSATAAPHLFQKMAVPGVCEA